MPAKLSVLVASIAIIAALTGCSAPASTDPGKAGTVATPSASPSPSSKTAAEIGKPFPVKQSNGTAQITVESATYGAILGGPFDSPASNGGYLILDILWETSSGTTSSNPLYVKAKDAAGHEGEIALGVLTPLGSGDVPKGDKTRGNVAFNLGAGPYIVAITDQLLQEQGRVTVQATAR